MKLTLKQINEIIETSINEAKMSIGNTLTESEKSNIVRMLTEAKKEGTDKEKDTDTSKKKKNKKSNKVLKHQVVSLLNQDKIDMAAIGRIVYPDMDDDTLRSYISKIARGKEEIPDNRVNDFYRALQTQSKGRKGKTA